MPTRAEREAFFRGHFAHRGLIEEDRPENSMAAFHAAAEAGYGIELDVRLSADEEVVVFHDARLKRMTGSTKSVCDCTVAELAHLTLGNSREGIPQLSEVLAAVNGRVPLLIELKHGKRNGALVTRTVDVLKGYRGAVAVQSFHPGILRAYRKADREILRGQLLRRQSSPWKEWLQGPLLYLLAKPDFWSCPLDRMTPRLRRFYRRFFRRPLLAWRVFSEGDAAACGDDFDALIFEKIRP